MDQMRHHSQRLNEKKEGWVNAERWMDHQGMAKNIEEMVGKDDFYDLLTNILLIILDNFLLVIYRKCG